MERSRCLVAMQRFLEVVRRALEVSPEGDYCVLRYDEYGNPHHDIDWSVIHSVYGCTIYVRPPNYSRRLIVVPGAVIAYSTDGPYRRCAAYRTLDVLREVDERWEIHVFETPSDIEFARAVCLR